MPHFDLNPALRTCTPDDSLVMTLRRNLGKVCTIHVPGEPSPLGVTGVLSEVNANSCKLISLYDTPPLRGCDRDRENARRIHTIPLDKITYVDTSQY